MKVRKEFVLIAATLLLILLLLRQGSHNIAVARRIFIPPLALIGCFYVFRLLPFLPVFRRGAGNQWRGRAPVGDKHQTETGIISYSEEQFTYPFHNESKTISWSQIRALAAYKEDRNTYDEICLMLLFDGGGRFLIKEGTPGWYFFLEQLAKHLPINPQWTERITDPPFARSQTVLYDRDGIGELQVLKEAFKA